VEIICKYSTLDFDFSSILAFYDSGATSDRRLTMPFHAVHGPSHIVLEVTFPSTARTTYNHKPRSIDAIPIEYVLYQNSFTDGRSCQRSFSQAAMIWRPVLSIETSEIRVRLSLVRPLMADGNLASLDFTFNVPFLNAMYLCTSTHTSRLFR